MGAHPGPGVVEVTGPRLTPTERAACLALVGPWCACVAGWAAVAGPLLALAAVRRWWTA